MKKVSPSMLSSDFSDLKNDLKSVCDYADYLHIDVMDGVFVNNISFGLYLTGQCGYSAISHTPPVIMSSFAALFPSALKAK